MYLTLALSRTLLYIYPFEYFGFGVGISSDLTSDLQIISLSVSDCHIISINLWISDFYFSSRIFFDSFNFMNILILIVF